MTQPLNLRNLTQNCVGDYLKNHPNGDPDNLYQLVMHEVEYALLRTVWQYYQHNQSQCAAALGISRTTLRKKLQKHQLLE